MPFGGLAFDKSRYANLMLPISTFHSMVDACTKMLILPKGLSSKFSPKWLNEVTATVAPQTTPPLSSKSIIILILLIFW